MRITIDLSDLETAVLAAAADSRVWRDHFGAGDWRRIESPTGITHDDVAGAVAALASAGALVLTPDPDVPASSGGRWLPTAFGQLVLDSLPARKERP